MLTASKHMSDMFEKALSICNNAKSVANWLLSDVSRILNEKELEPSQIPFTAEQLAEMIILIDKGTISSAIGKKVLEELFENPKNPEEIVKEKGWIQTGGSTRNKNAYPCRPCITQKNIKLWQTRAQKRKDCSTSGSLHPMTG